MASRESIDWAVVQILRLIFGTVGVAFLLALGVDVLNNDMALVTASGPQQIRMWLFYLGFGAAGIDLARNLGKADVIRSGLETGLWTALWMIMAITIAFCFIQDFRA